MLAIIRERQVGNALPSLLARTRAMLDSGSQALHAHQGNGWRPWPLVTDQVDKAAGFAAHDCLPGLSFVIPSKRSMAAPPPITHAQLSVTCDTCLESEQLYMHPTSNQWAKQLQGRCPSS